MALSSLTVCSLLMVVALVNGQMTPQATAPGCVDPRIQAGTSHMPHETYCQLFYNCDAGMNRKTQSCGPGTLYDYVDQVCKAPEQTRCNNWPCDANNIGKKYPATCCNGYYLCSGGSGFEYMECDGDQKFDMISGTCTSTSTCQDHLLCSKFGTVGDPNYVCYDKPNPDGNPCRYMTEVPNLRIENRPCPYGTSFNSTACQCSTLSSACPMTRGYAVNKDLDPECRPSMYLDFDSFPLTSYSDKMSTQGKDVLPYIFQTIGVSVSAGNAVMRTDPTLGAKPSIYLYALNANDLGMPLALRFLFKWESPSNGDSFTLVVNNYNGICMPTLNCIVTYTNNQFSLRCNATGITRNGLTESRLSAEVQGSIQMSPSNYVEVVVMFDRGVSAQLSDRGANGQNANPTNVVNINRSNTLGERLASNQCGYTFFEGFNGMVDRVSVHEGCGDFTKVTK